MDTLNEYCLIHIFQFLNVKDWINVQEVCKKWKRILQSFWGSMHRLEESFHGSKKDEIIGLNRDEFITITKSAAPFIRLISLHSRQFNLPHYRLGNVKILTQPLNNEILLEEIGPQLGEVENLNLGRGDFKSELVFMLMTTNNNLRVLSLGTCRLDLFSIPDIILKSVKDVALTIANSTGVENVHWPFPEVEALRLTITFMPQEKTNKILKKILPFSKQLKFLALNMKFFLNEKTISLSALSHLSELTNLETIIIHVTGDKFDDDFIVNMTENCKLLKNVELHFHVKKDSLQALLSVPQLETLIVDKISNFPKQNLVLCGLATLSINFQSDLSPEEFDHLREAVRHYMPGLENLSVFNISTEQCLTLSNDTINLALEQDKVAHIFQDRYNPLLQVYRKCAVPEQKTKLRITISEQNATYVNDLISYVKQSYPDGDMLLIVMEKVPVLRVSLPMYQIRFDESHFNNP